MNTIRISPRLKKIDKLIRNYNVSLFKEDYFSFQYTIDTKCGLLEIKLWKELYIGKIDKYTISLYVDEKFNLSKCFKLTKINGIDLLDLSMYVVSNDLDDHLRKIQYILDNIEKG